MKMSSQGLARLKFVKEGDKTSDPIMTRAVESVEAAGQSVQWVESDEIEVTSVDKNSIYVFDIFDTPLFHKIAGKTRIIGPMVILAHLKNNWPLPASRQPVFTMVMHGVTVCCTQTGARDKRTKILELVKLMGGKTIGNFTRHVTHLIAGQVGSTKYKVARSLGTPVLCSSWVDKCWEEGQKRLIHATDADIMSCHRCPPLSGCVVSSTGFSMEGRSRLRTLAEKHGAEYTSHLAKDTCTHLIVGDITSKKYHYAREWKVLCLTEQWLHDSIKSGYCMEEQEYLIEDNKDEKKQEKENEKNSGNKDGGKSNMEEKERSDTTNHRKRQATDSVDVVNKKSKKEVENNDEDDELALLTQYQNAEMPALPVREGDIVKNGLFSGMSLSINECLSIESRQAVIREIEKRGGKIVSSSSPCDYHISSLSLPPSLPPPSHATIVTLIWLERSLSAESILDPSSHFLFKPLPVTLSDTVLEGCVLTISQYDGLDREHLICLSQSLGAIVQDCFARYPSQGLLATTHLMLREAKGEKYESALSWGVPAVCDRWLFACASSQKIVPVNDYMVSLTTPTTQSKEKVTSNRKATPDDITINEEDMMRSFHPQYDIQDVSLGPLQYEGPNTQLAGIFDNNIHKALETVNEAEEEAIDRNNVLRGTVICVHKKLGSQQSELHRMVTSLGGQWRNNYDKQCTHFLFQGKPSEVLKDKQLQTAKQNNCILVSHYWLIMCSQTGQQEDETLYPCNYNPNRTIPVLSQRIINKQTKEDIKEETRQEEETHHDEELHQEEETHQEEEIHQDEETHHDEETHQEEETHQDEEEVKREDQEYEDRMIEEMEHDIEIPPVPPPPQDNGTDILKKQYQDIIENAGKRNQKRRQIRRLLRREGERSPSKERSPKSRRKLPRRFNRHGGSPPNDIHITDSQLMTVTYDDPDSREQQERLLAFMRQEKEDELVFEDHPLPIDQSTNVPSIINIQSPPAKDTQPCINSPHQQINTSRQTRSMSRATKEHIPNLPCTPVAPPLGLPIVTHGKLDLPNEALYDDNKQYVQKSRQPHQKKIVFLLSSLNVQEKADYGALIQDLGGEYCESDHFTSKCTHLVVGRSSRTEKYLAACASGKWVLGRTYMEACRAKNEFVEENEYEWGVQTSGKATPLDDAPKKWRVKIERKKRGRPDQDISNIGAFEGWKVMLCVEQAKQNGLRRLLEAGGATVVPSTQLVSAITSNYLTHAFLNPSCIPRGPLLSVELLVQHNVHCMRPDYIAEYLQKETPSTSEQFILPEALKLMHQHTGN